MCNTQQKWKEIQNSNPTKKINMYVQCMYFLWIKSTELYFFLLSKSMLLNKDQIL